MRKLPKVLLEMAWFTPIAMVIAAAETPGRVPAAVAWVGGASLLGGCASLLPARRRLPGGIAAALIWLAAFGVAGPAFPLLVRLGLSVTGTVAASVAARQIHRPIGESYPNTRWISGLIVHASCWIILFFIDKPARDALGWMALGYTLLMLFFVHASSLRGASFESASLPASVPTGNRVLMSILAAVILTVVHISTLARWAGAAFHAVLYGVMAALRWLSALFPDGSSEGGGAGGQPDLSGLLGGETPEPSLLARILEIALYAIAGAVVLAALAGLCYFLFRLGKKLWARFRDALSLYRKGFDESYTDEVTSIAKDDAASLAARLRERLAALLTPPIRWEHLDHRARVRFAFAGLMKGPRKRGALPDSMTPAEMLEDGRIAAREGDVAQLVDSYQRARYSRHEIGAADADNARKTMRR